MNWQLGKQRRSMSLTGWVKGTVQMWLATRSRGRCMRSCCSSRDASPTPSMRNSHYPVCTNLPKVSCLEMSHRVAKWLHRMFRPLLPKRVPLDRHQPSTIPMCSPPTRAGPLSPMSKLKVGILWVRGLRHRNLTASQVCTTDSPWDCPRDSKGNAASSRALARAPWVHKPARRVPTSTPSRDTDPQLAT